MSKETVTIQEAFAITVYFLKDSQKENEQLRSKLRTAIDALSFYGDKKLYYTKEIEVDMNQTTAMLKDEYRKNNPDISKPNILKSQSYECSAKIKLDQGSRASDAIKEIGEINELK